MKIDGIAAIVTGGASGLGAATATRLAAGGAKVAIFDLNEELGRETAARIGGSYYKTNVTSDEGVAASIAEAEAANGIARVLVNCAGVGTPLKTVGRDGQPHPLDAFRKVVEINLIGTFDVTRQAATVMSRNEPDADGQRGAIVNLASVAAFDGQIGQASYSASKGGVVGMTLPVARDLSAAGIRLNTVAPGLIDTPIYDAFPNPDEFKANLGQNVLFPKRLGRADELASMVVECLTNSYMNGETIRVDGGIRMPPK